MRPGRARRRRSRLVARDRIARALDALRRLGFRPEPLLFVISVEDGVTPELRKISALIDEMNRNPRRIITMPPRWHLLQVEAHQVKGAPELSKEEARRVLKIPPLSQPAGPSYLTQVFNQKSLVP